VSKFHACDQGHCWQGEIACPICGAWPSASDSNGLQTLGADDVPPAVSVVPTLRLSVAEPSTDLPIVAGYESKRLLGRGGMGVVYLAWQPALSRHVALKMVLAGAHAGVEGHGVEHDDVLVLRFRRAQEPPDLVVRP